MIRRSVLKRIEVEDGPPQPMEPGRVITVGVIAVCCGLFLAFGVGAWAPDDPTPPMCGDAPVNAYRSAGHWYSGKTIVGSVDPYNPDCFPAP